MKTEELEKYKKLLEKERAELVAQIDRDKHEDFGSDVDEDEETDEAESFGAKLAVDQELRERAGEIDIALSKIREEKYGICEKCGGEIGKKVLDASPESKFCKNCKLDK